VPARTLCCHKMRSRRSSDGLVAAVIVARAPAGSSSKCSVPARTEGHKLRASPEHRQNTNERTSNKQHGVVPCRRSPNPARERTQPGIARTQNYDREYGVLPHFAATGFVSRTSAECRVFNLFEARGCLTRLLDRLIQR
jgi:hypothetical protein